jgi:hypothetical protein
MQADILESIRSLQNPISSYRFQNIPPMAPFLSKMTRLTT